MKKKYKVLPVALAALLLILPIAGCGEETGAGASTPAAEPSTTTAASELENGKFATTRSITVEVFDRGNDGGSRPENNFYTDFIKEGMLRDHNVEVTFVPVGRWVEVEQLNNLLAAGDAPDVCVTYSYPTIQTYANMGGVRDLAPYVDGYKSELPNLWGWLGETNIYWNKDPYSGVIWAIESKLRHNARISTFVRQDWLNKLNIKEPTTLEEFEAMLKAFKNNAGYLLGADASKMIPFSISYDVGWRADHLLSMFIPNNITDKDFYVYGFDDRHFLHPGIKEGVRKLNEWYNAGLIWEDFPMHPAGDTTEDNLMKAGYVGSFMHNWDYPYRNGADGVHQSLQRVVGDEAVYVAVEPFKNSAGLYRKYLAGPIDRKIFFPSTNKQPLASMLYLDWLSKLENRMFLQIGQHGVTHETEADGAVRTLAAKGAKIINSPYNIDYNLVINGLDLGDDDKTIKSVALGYAGVDGDLVAKAYFISTNQGRVEKNVQVGQIKAEEGVGPALNEKRNVILDMAVIAPVDQFDALFDVGMKDYLNTGGQAIIDERLEAWDKVYGDAVNLP